MEKVVCELAVLGEGGGRGEERRRSRSKKRKKKQTKCDALEDLLHQSPVLVALFDDEADLFLLLSVK